MVYLSNKNVKIASGVIAGTIAVTSIGIALKAMRKPKSRLQRNTARTLNTIGSVAQTLADMIG